LRRTVATATTEVRGPRDLRGKIMPQAQQGDTVKVHYEGKLEDGTIFDSSHEGDPLEFTIGAGHIIPGFESVVVGMELGEERTETIACEQAYGPFLDEMVQEVERGNIPPDIELEVGKQLQVQRPGEPPLVLTICDLSDETVTLDANHPLAGKDLVFTIELVDIVS
jgi:peptidylprolyl isomerase